MAFPEIRFEGAPYKIQPTGDGSAMLTQGDVKLLFSKDAAMNIAAQLGAIAHENSARPVSAAAITPTPDHEALISVNGLMLTKAQSITVRMACTIYLLEMANPDALGDDKHGRTMAENYKGRLEEVLGFINGVER